MIKFLFRLMSCPSCGGSCSVDRENREAVCTDCGYSFFF